MNDMLKAVVWAVTVAAVILLVAMGALSLRGSVDGGLQECYEASHRHGRLAELEATVCRWVYGDIDVEVTFDSSTVYETIPIGEPGQCLVSGGVKQPPKWGQCQNGSECLCGDVKDPTTFRWGRCDDPQVIRHENFETPGGP